MDKNKKLIAGIIIVLALFVLAWSSINLVNYLIDSKEPGLTEVEIEMQKIEKGWQKSFAGEVQEIDREEMVFYVYSANVQQENTYRVLVNQETLFFFLEIDMVEVDGEMIPKDTEIKSSFKDLKEGMYAQVEIFERLDLSFQKEFLAKKVTFESY